MKKIILKCWNGLYGCSSFEVIGWEYDFNNPKEAQKYYEQIWARVWFEDTNGNIIKI